MFGYLLYHNYGSVSAIRKQSLLGLVCDKGALLPSIVQEVTRPSQDLKIS